MAYRVTQEESRRRYLSEYDALGAAKYDAWIQTLGSPEHDACLADLRECAIPRDGMEVLDAGSGTGGLSLALVRIPGIRLTALEPCPAMIDLFVSKPELSGVKTTCGFCDHLDDQPIFASASFDFVISRQLTNCLYDPLAAFRNWYQWLRPGGTVVVMDGQFNRDAWAGSWADMVDELPLSACQSTATVPYLLEQVGFLVSHAGPMIHTNALSSTRTPRYIIAANRPLE